MQISYLRSWLILLIVQLPSMAKNVTSGIIKQVLGRESSSLKVVTKYKNLVFFPPTLLKKVFLSET